MNKTKKYLLPCLVALGPEFEQQFIKVFKVAIGIGDIITIKSNIKFEKHIFILIDMNQSIDTFSDFQIWIRNHPMYETDYAYDDLLTGHLHMLVIKLPEEFYSTYETFKKSKYSKMYTPEQLKRFIKQETVKKILVRDNEYKFEFVKQLKERYGDLDLTPDDIDNSFEFDFPIDDEEIFNEHLK